MIRRLIIGPGAAAVLVLSCVVGNMWAGAATSGAACTISGSATISPGLTTTAKAQSITLTNVTLANCRSGNATGPNTKVTTGSVSPSPNPVSATASCASGNLALTATIFWSTGQTTTATIKTTGVTANQLIQGTVTSSTNPAVASGSLLKGDVAFKPTTTAQNCAKVPVTAVTFSGAIATGTPK